MSDEETISVEIDRATILRTLTDAYCEIKRVDRTLEPNDRLIEDLELDSLDAIDMFTLIEESMRVHVDFEYLVEELEKGMATVSELLTAVERGIETGGTPDD